MAGRKQQPLSSPRKSNPQGKAPDQLSQMEWGGFINIPLSDANKEKFEVWSRDENNDQWGIVEELLVDGGKLTLSYNPINDTTNASVTGALVKGESKRYSLSCFAPQWQTALLVLAFKYAVVAERDLANFIAADTRKTGGIG